MTAPHSLPFWNDKRNPRTTRLHELSITDCVETLIREERHAFDAVKRAGPRLARIVDAVTPGLLHGGRLFYCADGPVARLAALDAEELPSAFHISPSPVQFVDLPRDVPPDAVLDRLSASPRDTLLGLAARDPSAPLTTLLEASRARLPQSRPLTCLISCGTADVATHADHTLLLKTGPEVVSGDFRRKAGTSLKMALNVVSTTLMVQLGKVYENLVVDPHPDPHRAAEHALYLVATLTQLAPDASQSLLESAAGCPKTAILMHRLGCSADHAAAQLARASGRLSVALADNRDESRD
jgi:N-acetylmuramic acid 6-phosphate etherase